MNSLHLCNRFEGADLAFPESAAASVFSLLFRRRPPAVFGAVAFAHVDTVKRGPLGARAHVCQKGFKRVCPAITDGNAHISGHRSASSRQPAPMLHGVPTLIFRSLSLAVGFAVCANKFGSQAPAGLRVAASKLVPCFGCNSATVALANPLHSFALACRPSRNVSVKNDKTAKSLAGSINEGAHDV